MRWIHVKNVNEVLQRNTVNINTEVLNDEKQQLSGSLHFIWFLHYALFLLCSQDYISLDPDWEDMRCAWWSLMSSWQPDCFLWIGWGADLYQAVCRFFTCYELILLATISYSELHLHGIMDPFSGDFLTQHVQELWGTFNFNCIYCYSFTVKCYRNCWVELQ